MSAKVNFVKHCTKEPFLASNSVSKAVFVLHQIRPHGEPVLRRHVKTKGTFVRTEECYACALIQTMPDFQLSL